MFLLNIISSHNNDFKGTLKCEHCGHEQKINHGYNDAFYHNKIIPSKYCKHCNKNRAGTVKETVPE